MIPLEETEEGLVFFVHVRPGASRRDAGGEHGGALKVSTTAPPEGGEANEDVIRILSERLGLRRSRITLLSGFKNRRKRIRIDGMSRQALERLLEDLAE
jgi:uncharacterized protein (TIGR00251 family)